MKEDNININDELLIMAAEHTDSFSEAISIASVALFEIYKMPFFNNQYQKYQLGDNNGFINMLVSNHSRDGIKYNMKNNEFDFHVVKKIKEKFNYKYPEYNHYYDEDRYEDLIYADKDNAPDKKILSSENLELIERTKKILENNSFDNFLKDIKDEIENDPKYLIKLYSVFDDSKLFKILKEFIVLDKESNEDGNLGIKLYFKEKNPKKGGFKLKIVDDHFYRDTLSDWFLFSNRRFEKTGKDILKELLEDRGEFEFFLSNTGEVDKYEKENYSKKEIKNIIKSLLKDKNEYAITIFKTNPEERKYKLFNKIYKESANKILESLDKLNISEQSIEQVVEKNKDIVDKMKGIVLKKYPYLNSNKIPQDEVTILMGCAKLMESGLCSTPKVMGEEDVFGYFPSLRKMENIEFYNDGELDTAYNRKERFEDKMFKSKFSINSDFVSFSDGFNLFNKNSFNYAQGKTGFYLDFKYKDQVIAKASIFEGGKGRELFVSVGSVEVAKPYRGQGLSYLVYNKIADICSQNNKIIKSSSYTEDGKGKIPQVKEKIQSQRKDVLFSHEAYGFYSMENKSEVLHSLIIEHEVNDYKNALKLKTIIDYNWDNWMKSKNKLESSSYEEKSKLTRDINEFVGKELSKIEKKKIRKQKM